MRTGDEEQLFPISVLDRRRGNELTLKQEGGRLNSRKNFLDAGAVGLQNELPWCSSAGQCLLATDLYVWEHCPCVGVATPLNTFQTREPMTRTAPRNTRT